MSVASLCGNARLEPLTIKNRAKNVRWYSVELGMLNIGGLGESIVVDGVRVEPDQFVKYCKWNIRNKNHPKQEGKIAQVPIIPKPFRPVAQAWKTPKSHFRPLAQVP